ncbi:hypothetical protein [Massilia pseudoviolaceinigra]|uniref:hypothetical protein n=1 Tax=Massilia pseudoviolaceinigra TaxID=3057165 RepID=UPI002796ADA7|nr:hypothetical protein [Massilia sp. CCM 9206]MDQ1923814.1 hypothetical protein [Massilia sp. CCM 9206]
MNIQQYAVRLPAALAIATLFTACGGGGGDPTRVPGRVDTPSTPTPTPTPTPTDTRPDGCKAYIAADKTVAADKAGGASVLSCGAPLADVSWTQVSGPAVTLQAARTPTITFEPREKGVIALRADVTLADGSRQSLSTDVTVTEAPVGSFLTLRADHSVRPGTETSVRAWPNLFGGDKVVGIVWTQVSGPTVTMNTEDPQLLMFKAPDVTADVALRFRATMTLNSGVKDSDDVLISLDRQAAPGQGALFDITARVHPYRQAGAYAAVLARCTYDVGVRYSGSSNTLCSSEVLPPLQTEAGIGAVPSVAQVMGRVLVSHDFLGANFEQFLLTQDANSDFRRLLASVSTIVIGSHVRPSFYSAGTGAIYLDANNLWLTAEQRDVVTEVPDYRSAFDDNLNFIPLGRSVKNNAYARRSYPSTARVTRTTDELLFDLGRLMYHELAHANDFLPSVERAMNPQRSIWENIVDRVGSRTLPSDALAVQFPLQSSEMLGMGQVLYQGKTATSVQKGYTAADIGRFFGSDRASDDYAYSIFEDDSSREDLAMLFEEFMMSYRHDVRYDVGYINQTTGSDLIVGWGQRGRIAEPAIKPRIKLVLQRIAPWIDASAVDRLPAPLMMRAGESWDANLVLNPPGGFSKQSALRKESADERAARLRGDIRQRERHGKMTPDSRQP